MLRLCCVLPAAFRFEWRAAIHQGQNHCGEIGGQIGSRTPLSIRDIIEPNSELTVDKLTGLIAWALLSINVLLTWPIKQTSESAAQQKQEVSFPKPNF